VKDVDDDAREGSVDRPTGIAATTSNSGTISMPNTGTHEEETDLTDGNEPIITITKPQKRRQSVSTGG
jgi:hypothetical protein